MNSCGALGRASYIHVRLRRLATIPGEKRGLESSMSEPNREIRAIRALALEPQSRKISRGESVSYKILYGK